MAYLEFTTIIKRNPLAETFSPEAYQDWLHATIGQVLTKLMLEELPDDQEVFKALFIAYYRHQLVENPRVKIQEQPEFIVFTFGLELPALSIPVMKWLLQDQAIENSDHPLRIVATQDSERYTRQSPDFSSYAWSEVPRDV